MRNLIQEACQGPVRSAVAEHGEAVAGLRDADLRAVSCAGARLGNQACPHQQCSRICVDETRLVQAFVHLQLLGAKNGVLGRVWSADH
jgi:hypothetical protein